MLRYASVPGNDAASDECSITYVSSCDLNHEALTTKNNISSNVSSTPYTLAKNWSNKVFKHPKKAQSDGLTLQQGSKPMHSHAAPKDAQKPYTNAINREGSKVTLLKVEF